LLGQSGKAQASSPLRLGWIPYWNLLPLRQELERLVGSDLEFHRGHPAQVNKWLAEAKVQLAPSSSVCLVKNSAMEVAVPVGIASLGPVLSVYLGLQQDDGELTELLHRRQALLREIFKLALQRYEGDVRSAANFIFSAADDLPPVPTEKVPVLNITPASATSTQLARILYRLWFGETNYEQRAGSNIGLSAVVSTVRPVDLLIGDEALVKRAAYRSIIDLGDVWRDLTDLPFVFAVWQCSKRPLSTQWRQRIIEAAELAQARMRVEPSNYFPDPMVVDMHGKPIDLAAYWRGIHYRLGPSHFRGLALFLALTRSMQPSAIDDQAVVKMMRWESYGQMTMPST
jgi:predicted solute-binding protein